LEARNKYLEMERDFAKKVLRASTSKPTLTLVRNVEFYQAITELQGEKQYSITELCQLAGIARSAYYKWLKWTPSKKECENQKLAKEIKKKFDSKERAIDDRLNISG
jgi:hypothetical protein